MPYKVNISEKNGKTYHLEVEAEELAGKVLHDKIEGVIISPDLEGYEFEITGASDNAGFPSLDTVSGIGLKKVLLTYGKGMKKRHKREGKKPISNPKPKGLRQRKRVRGKTISHATVQVNLKVLKQGNKNLEELFPDQGKKKETQAQSQAKPTEPS
jgi:ribosomal protein S6E (S10)